jgi:phytoene/squalene synthetase
LALYALKQAIGSIAFGPADDSVKWAKLKWWSEELVAEPGAPARHPVLRALWMTGARTRLADSLLLRLVGDAISQIDVAPDSDQKAMFERLATLGETEIQLELALDDAEIDVDSLSLLSAASGAHRFISSFSGNRLAEAGRLPLNLLARHNVSVSQLEQHSHTEALAKIISQLAGEAMEWFEKGMSGLNLGPRSSDSAHLQLRWAMEHRRLNVIRQDTHQFLEAGKSFGPADAWFAWRFLRKLK